MKIDVTRLPSPQTCVKQRIKRVNYRCAQFRRSHVHVFEMPPATDHGWIEVDDSLIPNWCDGPAIPKSLEELMPSNINEESESDAGSEDDDDEDEAFSSNQESDSDSCDEDADNEEYFNSF